MSGYYKIARHYNYSINYVLNTLNYDAIIITEGSRFFEIVSNWTRAFFFCFLLDDLELSPDFLDYFKALYPLLVYDKSLWCISAWNDNGVEKKVIREPSKKMIWKGIKKRDSCFSSITSIGFLSWPWLVIDENYLEWNQRHLACWVRWEFECFPWRKVFRMIDFGMIGCDCPNNVMIELVFDRNYLEQQCRSKEKKVSVSE